MEAYLSAFCLAVYILFMPADWMFFLFEQFTFIPNENDSPMDSASKRTQNEQKERALEEVGLEKSSVLTHTMEKTTLNETLLSSLHGIGGDYNWICHSTL